MLSATIGTTLPTRAKSGGVAMTANPISAGYGECGICVSNDPPWKRNWIQFVRS